MPAPKKNPGNFNEILKYIWWNLDKSLDKKTIEASALATAIACAKAGSTFVIDHHASPNFIEGSLEIISEAFDRIGISHLLCYEITDRDGLEKAEKGLKETEQYLLNKQGLVGLHASFTVGDKSIKNAVELMEKYGSGIHIHVAEDLYDQRNCRKLYQMCVAERLQKHGILESSKTILAHCLHINEEERELIRNSNAWIVQNTESNLKNDVGYFNGEDLGERIMMGTDGMHSDMLRSSKAAYLVGQRFDDIDYESAYYRFRNVHRYLNSNGIKGDGDNNLVVLDYPSPTLLNKKNFLGHFVFGLSSNDVQHVISKGKLIVKDKTIQTVDEKEILHFTTDQALRLWNKMLQ
jgi:cytosine/adenosine deaminase-related metal-dependent hydrolase